MQIRFEPHELQAESLTKSFLGFGPPHRPLSFSDKLLFAASSSRLLGDMADAQVQGARPPAGAAAQRQDDGASWYTTARSLMQTVGIFLLIQFAMKQFMPKTAVQTDSSTPSNINAAVFSPGANIKMARTAGMPEKLLPMWPVDVDLDIAMYLTPSALMPALTSMPSESLVFNTTGFRYGSGGDKRDFSNTVKVPEAVQKNGTLYMHVYIARSGYPLDPTSPDYDAAKAYRSSSPFTQYLTKRRVKKTRNLLSSADRTEDEPEDDLAEKGPLVANYFHPNLTLAFIKDSGDLVVEAIQPPLRRFVQVEPSGARDETGKIAWYFPILWANTFWQLRSHMTELNETVKELPINIHLKNENNWLFSMMQSIDHNVKENSARAARGEKLPGGGDGSEFEVIKEVLIDSNIYLLGTTAVVSILHMIFEMLAFKNDVSHWRKKKDNVGTSVRTILANVIMQSIIFLYLLDNNENTSWIILGGQGVSIAIEAWKITKTVNIRVRPVAAGALIPYRIAFEDKHKLSDTEKKTQEYDQIAFKWLYIIAVPLLGGYAVYSLVYDSHKSWYSFVIATLVGSVYAYGFALMIPSLYINYRLKSVAHMSGRAMVYKTMGTFIDDLFAFTIKMPLLHRISTLRDDVVFFVYLYQVWKYKVRARSCLKCVTDFARSTTAVSMSLARAATTRSKRRKWPPSPSLLRLMQTRACRRGR